MRNPIFFCINCLFEEGNVYTLASALWETPCLLLPMLIYTLLRAKKHAQAHPYHRFLLGKFKKYVLKG